jgi:hypothetical protein
MISDVLRSLNCISSRSESGERLSGDGSGALLLFIKSSIDGILILIGDNSSESKSKTLDILY